MILGLTLFAAIIRGVIPEFSLLLTSAGANDSTDLIQFRFCEYENINVYLQCTCTLNIQMHM